MRRLVALPTPLGGEIAALLRARDPANPLLQHELPLVDVLEDGSRPRIATPANREVMLARMHRLQLQQQRQEEEEEARGLAPQQRRRQQSGGADTPADDRGERAVHYQPYLFVRLSV